MIKAKQVFFGTSNLKGHGFHGEKATIFYLTFIICAVCKTLFLEIGPVHQNLRYLNVWYWKRQIQIFSAEKTL